MSNQDVSREDEHPGPKPRHCRTCTCTSEPKTFTIYPANGKLYGRCDSCKQDMWEVEYDHEFVGWAPRRSEHCGCCTHVHNLPTGVHDEACLADPADCDLADTRQS